VDEVWEMKYYSRFAKTLYRKRRPIYPRGYLIAGCSRGSLFGDHVRDNSVDRILGASQSRLGSADRK
jgi:hypothetical protein